MMVVYFGFILLVAYEKPLLTSVDRSRPERRASCLARWSSSRRGCPSGCTSGGPISTTTRGSPRCKAARDDHLLFHLHRVLAGHHVRGGAPHAQRRAFLHGRRRHHRPAERPGAGGRLHERRQLSRHRRPGRAVRIRRPDLLDRISGGLARRDVPDRRAPSQPRQVHVLRRRGVPAAAETRARGRRHRLAGRRGVLPDRADGGRRAI